MWIRNTEAPVAKTVVCMCVQQYMSYW